MREGNNAGGLPFDRSRAEADRRMRLLEMAGGDLEKAREMEAWVLTGGAEPVTIKSSVPFEVQRKVMEDIRRIEAEVRDELAIPSFLDRRRA